MALNPGKKIVQRNWDFITMPDTVIVCVNTLGSNHPKLLTFIDRHGRIIGDVETLGVGVNSDEGEVEFSGVDAELEEKDMEIPDMNPEGNFEIPGKKMEGQDPPPQFFEINDSDIPQDPSIIALEVSAEPDGPTQISEQSTEGPCRTKIVISQPDAYTPSTTGKRYGYAIEQLYIQGVLHPDAHMFAQENFTKPNPNSR